MGPICNHCDSNDMVLATIADSARKKLKLTARRRWYCRKCKRMGGYA